MDIVKKKAKFLEVYPRAMSVMACSKAIGISRATFYNWKKADKDFADAIEAIDDETAEMLLSTIATRARGNNSGDTDEQYLGLKQTKLWLEAHGRMVSKREIKHDIADKIHVRVFGVNDDEQKDD